MITAVALSAAVDVMYLVDAFEEGRIHRPTAVHRLPGGKALNAVRAAATVGADVRAVAMLGGDTGAFIARELAAAGIRTHVVQGAMPTRTCVTVASATSGLLTEIYEHPTEVSAAECEAAIESVREVLAGGEGWVLVSGGMPAAFADGGLDRVVRLAHESGHRIAIDSHGPALATALDARPDVVKVNRSEAMELVAAADGSLDLVEAAGEVQRRTGGIVIITDGEHGSVALDSRSAAAHAGRAAAWRVQPSARRGHYPTGSGDSFLGGLVAALDHGNALPDALRLAAACATANALAPGAAVFDADKAREIAGELEVTAL
ncbi:PfkB family carbohydrate kinase [Microbacterium sp. STN6]|uniref:1-phosphofructokinase family hexose kinase n=1 Tax=Microbacterium sp. STN6 TaxID=2995588 RepID=UPI0022609FB3|nr:PfkB family carbohydrate kinase [Microbacterium sp. STN6]MCX7523347.1 PfkB family carbohydrate kinase [Microbacterium sp. STN6]